jgi:pimeloyl-ACP methyl ester carboxylesterase
MYRRRNLPILLLLGCLPAASGALAGQERSMEQDPTLNNLVHPEGYQTATPGTFGHVEKRGSGDIPMVLIPGGGFGWTVFEDLMADHVSEYTFYAVTLAGMGGTPAPPMPPEGTSYGEQTWIRGGLQALRSLIRREDLESPVIVGHFKEGAHIALRMAIEHPGETRGVIIMGGAAKFANPQNDQYTLEQRNRYYDTTMAPQWFKTVTRKTWNDNNYPPRTYSRKPELADALYARLSQVPLPVLVRYLLEFWSADPTLEFDRIRVPTLVLMPSFDEDLVESSPFLTQYFVDSWNGIEENPLVEKRSIEDAHVFVWLDQPEIVGREVSRFVDSLRER